MHIVRGDLHANALTAALRCVFWFNPLLHLAARHFRQDQELACDLRVIARHPHARRAYGEAMFKNQLALHPLPLGCHWLAGNNRSHPLKERIAMLKQPVPSSTRWIGGVVLVAVLGLGVGFAAWSAQPARVVAAHDVPPPPAPPAPPPVPAPPAPPPAAIPPVAPAPPAPPTLPAPAYPQEALAQHVNGKVVLLIDIDTQGNPTNVVVDKSEPAGVFDQVSIDAARKWKFQPAVKDGIPVAGRISVPVQFESRGNPDPTGAKDSLPAPSAPGAQG
jgi:TonB family protein